MDDAVSSNPIRSLQIGMSWLPEQAGNGLDRMYHGLIQHLPDVGVSVRGVVAGSDRVASDSDHRIRAFAPDQSSLPHRLFAAHRSIRDILHTEPIDLLATHFALYTVPALRLLDDYPLVVHFHGPWAQESHIEGESSYVTRMKAWIERAVYRRGTRFIVLSSAFRDVLIRDYNVDPARIHIVPGGVHADVFDPACSRHEARNRLDWSPDRPTVVAVRRLARRMGLENLIRAIDTVRHAVPDVMLYLAGKGPLQPELQAQIDALELSDHVRLLGFVPEDRLPFVYRAADVSIVPTVALEGFGLITIESLAAGTPVLVTPRGGLPEVVSGLSEKLILPGDGPQALAEGLTQALRGTLPLPPPADCQAYVRRHFDWPVIAKKTRDVYDKALQ